MALRFKSHICWQCVYRNPPNANEKQSQKRWHNTTSLCRETSVKGRSDKYVAVGKQKYRGARWNASQVSTKRSGTKRGGRCQRRCFLGTSHRRETTGSSRRPQSWEQLRSGHGSLSCFHAARGVCGCLPFMQRHLLRGHVAMQYLGEISQHAAPP